MPTSNKIKTFMDSLSEFVCKIANSSSQKKVVVILPNFMAIDCFKANYLKNTIKGSCDAALYMPVILTIDQYIHKIQPEKSAGSILQHQQVLLMTGIIKSYTKTNYRANDAISIARQIIEIYWSLKRNSISYDEINAWVDEDLAQHWWATADFLNFCFKEYDLILLKNCSRLVDLNLNKDTIYIFAGLLDGFANDCEIIEPQIGIEKYLILPPVDSEKIEDKEYSYLRKNYESVIQSAPVCGARGIQTNIYNSKSYSILPLSFIKNGFAINVNMDSTLPTYGAALNDDNFTTSSYQPTYLEFYDIFEEAEYLVHKIENRKSTIGIITNNLFLKELIGYQLNLRNILYNSSFGTAYTDFLEVELLLNLGKFKSHNDISSFISLLNSRILKENDEIVNFISSLNNSGRFYENFEAAISEKSIEQSDFLQEIWKILKTFLDSKDTNFKKLFSLHIKVFELFYKKANLSSFKKTSEKFVSFVQDIQTLDLQEYQVDEEEYYEFLNSIFSQKFAKPFNRESDVYILTPTDALLIDFDEVIFADFNHDSYIVNTEGNIWLSNKILKKLDLYNESEQFDKLLYLVTAKQLSNNLILTRAKYKDGVIQEKCSILDFIQNIKNYQSESILEGINELSLRNSMLITKELLPPILYPTNIEHLILDPYGFFIKKVLGLRKKKDALSIPENSDFGTVVHELIERIETTPNVPHENIIDDIFQANGYDSKTKTLWTLPLLSIALQVDQTNRVVKQQGASIYSEIEGSCSLKLKTQEIILKAIADRIEVHSDKIRIIDYKTGAHPTKKDLSIGKAPQLLIEALILEEDGFSIDVLGNKKIELVYIKVNSKAPYLVETIIPITREELKGHKEAMIEFLDFYYDKEKLSVSPEYITESWKPNYDDYKHFRRL